MTIHSIYDGVEIREIRQEQPVPRCDQVATQVRAVLDERGISTIDPEKGVRVLTLSNNAGHCDTAIEAWTELASFTLTSTLHYVHPKASPTQIRQYVRVALQEIRIIE